MHTCRQQPGRLERRKRQHNNINVFMWQKAIANYNVAGGRIAKGSRKSASLVISRNFSARESCTTQAALPAMRA
jgi:hypothetical protein